MKRGNKPQSLAEAWHIHSFEMQHLPSPDAQSRSLLIWRERIDEHAPDYAEAVRRHRQRERITQLEANMIRQACLCGHMAHEGWVSPLDAQKGVLELSHQLRDELRATGVRFQFLAPNVETVIDQVLREIVDQAIEQGA